MQRPRPISLKQVIFLHSFQAAHDASIHATTKTRTDEFFSEIVPNEPSSSFDYFYQMHSAFSISLHRLNWELLKTELLVDLGRAPAVPEDQKIRNGLKTEAESQMYWLKYVGCRLRRLAEDERDGNPTVPPSTGSWNLFACNHDNVLHPHCLTRNKLINIKLKEFMRSLHEFVSLTEE